MAAVPATGRTDRAQDLARHVTDADAWNAYAARMNAKALAAGLVTAAELRWRAYGLRRCGHEAAAEHDPGVGGLGGLLREPSDPGDRRRGRRHLPAGSLQSL